jgi:hypothetical protein
MVDSEGWVYIIVLYIILRQVNVLNDADDACVTILIAS